MTKTDLSIVIVTYNSQDFIYKCLENLDQVVGLSNTNVYIIDNNSHDKTRDILKEYKKEITVILNPKNIGYGRACNQGFAVTNTPYVLFMNPDTFPEGRVLEQLVSYMQRNPKTAISQCRLLNADRTLQYSCREYPTTQIIFQRGLEILFHAKELNAAKKYLMKQYDHRNNRSVPWVMGALMLTHTDAFKAAGGFDPGYFLYCEDADLCRRLNLAGWAVDYLPQAGEAVHYHQMMSRKAGGTQSLILHMRSMLRFLWKSRKNTKRA